MKLVKAGEDLEGLQGDQLRKGGEERVVLGIRKTRELRY